MKLKKRYIYYNKRQIFRLIPTDAEKIIIEERDVEKKQAYFTCLQIDSGKKVFKNLQLDEKFWLGIEAVHKDIIFFHKFAKPDLPQHNGIIAFDINRQKILWEDNTCSFLFIKDDLLYSYRQGFDQRKYTTINLFSGEVVEELDTDSNYINLLREEVIKTLDFTNFYFPRKYSESEFSEQEVKNYLKKLRENIVISGSIEYVKIGSLLLFNFHTVTGDNYLKNIFNAVDLSDGNCIFKETLNSRTNAVAPDSFFVRNDLLFLLIERLKLGVYKIIN